MSRSAYGKWECNICGRIISFAGFARVNHQRKHVREGLLIEHYEYSENMGYWRWWFERVRDEQEPER